MKTQNIIKSTIIVLFFALAFTFIFNTTLHFIQNGYEKDAIIRIPYISEISHQDNSNYISNTDYTYKQDSILNPNNEYYHKSFYRFNSEINYDSILNLYQSRINLANWFIAFIGAILTFLAFYVQYAFNSRQKEDIANERFENKLFHLLDVYRNICSKTSVAKAGDDKNAFHYMFYEYKAIFNLLYEKRKTILHNNTDSIKTNEEIEILNYIAFTCFINGVNSSGIEIPINNNLANEAKIEIDEKHIRELLLELQEKGEKATQENPEEGIKYLMDYRNKNIKYFDGHRPRFIPYIKYIMLIAGFIASNKSSQNNAINLLISEQTDHEIGLIYAYNGYCNYIAENIQQHKHCELFKTYKYLFDQMYDSLPKHLKHKFIYNSSDPSFFS